MPQDTIEYQHEEEGDLTVVLEKNESPINLFNIDTEAFPSAKHIERHYSLNMNPGDCVYVPAYNFIQVNGKAKV